MNCIALDLLKKFFAKKSTRDAENSTVVKPLEDADGDTLSKIENCEKNIGYTFTDKYLILEALKHRSYLSVTKEERYKSNERLEFLGDAVLELIVTEYLFHKYPHDLEGPLSKRKSALVSRAVLAKVATKLGIGESILLNRGEEKTGGRTRTSLLANTFESILGAIYLDSGYEEAKKFVNRYLLDFAGSYFSESSVQNYKSELLEFSQSLGWGAPEYVLLKEEGPDHDKIFSIAVKVNRKLLGEGKGASKKAAEQEAAREALLKIKEDPEKFSERELK